VFAFIEGFYNPRRRHSSIGYLSPIDCPASAPMRQKRRVEEGRISGPS